jgi:hypothetical protein
MHDSRRGETHLGTPAEADAGGMALRPSRTTSAKDRLEEPPYCQGGRGGEAATEPSAGRRSRTTGLRSTEGEEEALPERPREGAREAHNGGVGGIRPAPTTGGRRTPIELTKLEEITRRGVDLVERRQARGTSKDLR